MLFNYYGPAIVLWHKPVLQKKTHDTFLHWTELESVFQIEFFTKQANFCDRNQFSNIDVWNCVDFLPWQNRQFSIFHMHEQYMHNTFYAQKIIIGKIWCTKTAKLSIPLITNINMSKGFTKERYAKSYICNYCLVSLRSVCGPFKSLSTHSPLMQIILGTISASLP